MREFLFKEIFASSQRVKAQEDDCHWENIFADVPIKIPTSWNWSIAVFSTYKNNSPWINVQIQMLILKM